MARGILIDPVPPLTPDPPPPGRARARTRQGVVAASAGLVLWLSGLLPVLWDLLRTHPSQVTLAAALYLLFRHLGWVPLAALGLLAASPALAMQQWRKRRRGPIKEGRA